MRAGIYSITLTTHHALVQLFPLSTYLAVHPPIYLLEGAMATV